MNSEDYKVYTSVIIEKKIYNFLVHHLIWGHFNT
jgi:hypothetical protein